MNPIIIGLHGKKFSGKSASATYMRRYLSEEHEGKYFCIKLGFAEPLKRMLIALGVPERNVYDEKFKEIPVPEFGGLTARKMMQDIGMFYRKTYGDNFWLDQMQREIDKSLQNNNCKILAPVVFIDDVRFNNEAEFINSKGGVVVKVTRPEIICNDLHPSENGIHYNLVDFDILNSGDCSYLWKECSRITKWIIGEHN